MNILYYSLMNITVNSFILVSVNDTLSLHLCSIGCQQFQAKAQLKHLVNRR